MKQLSETFQITKKDNLRYHLFLMRNKLVATSALVFCVLLVMITIIRYLLGVGIQSALLSGVFMGLAGTAFLLVINILTAVLRINSYYQQNTPKNISVTFHTDADGIHTISDRGNVDLPWDRIVAVRETRHAFYIFITESHANVMPKEQVSHADAIAAFRALLEKNVAKTRLKIGRTKSI